jgi:predicted SAM-dependent methyltransferase
MIKLDIGSGGKSSDSSFIGVDAFAEGADVKAFMWELPYEDNSVDVIFSSQALEHVSKFAVPPTLLEWKRVLKPGGKLQIQVPDLQWACMHWLSHQTTGWDLDIIYGNQLHEGEYHKTGFTDTILRQYVEWAGFEIHKIDFLGSTLEEAVYGQPNTGISQRAINLEAFKPISKPTAE